MIILSGLIFLPRKLLLVLGIIILLGHNTLDSIQFQGSDPLSVLWYFTHQHNFLVINEGQGMLAIAYPFLPWLGIMILGYCFGHYYIRGFDPAKRRRTLVVLGISSICAFVILRSINIYGDLKPLDVEKNFIYTVLSFINTTKYPPSLIYTLMTLGPALIFLYAIELVRNKFTAVMVIIGRVPFFFYVLHLYHIHLIGMLGLIFLGENWKELILTPDAFKSNKLYSLGYDLWVTYLVWILVLVLLYPLCKRYALYKASNKHKWWLSYL
jgi:uncharacterized membrane protein